MIDGILLINKEEGITSYDVIRKLKKILPKDQKIGHAGTLDPFANGLLIVLLGKGTKLMESMHTLDKEYTVVAEFGYSTDTQDLTGTVVEKCDDFVETSPKEIEDIIKRNFLGKQLQKPPMYSAKKVEGQKAYDLARKGIEVELKEKEIEVKIFEIIEYMWPKVTFRIICTTGTYVRTLVHDLGKIVGCNATAVSLCRNKIGRFTLDSSVKSSSLENEEIREKVITLDNVGL